METEEQRIIRRIIIRVMGLSACSVVLFAIIRFLRIKKVLIEFRVEDFALILLVVSVGLFFILRRSLSSGSRHFSADDSSRFAITKFVNFSTSVGLFSWSVGIFALTLLVGRSGGFLSKQNFNTLTGNEADNVEYLSNCIEWFGIPYGLVVAAVLVQAWLLNERILQKLDDEHDHIDQVATLLEKVSRHSRFVKIAPEVEKLKSALAVYYFWVRYCFCGEAANRTDHLRATNLIVLGQPWTKNQVDRFQKIGTQLLKGIHNQVIEFFLRDEQESQVIAEKIFEHSENLYDARGDRVDATNSRIETLMNLLLGFATFVWLAPFWLLATSSSIAMPLSVGGAWAATVAGFGIVEILQHYRRWPLVSEELQDIFKDNSVLSVKEGNSMPIQQKKQTLAMMVDSCRTEGVDAPLLEKFIEHWEASSAHLKEKA